METPPDPPPGFMDSLRQLGDGLAASLQDRLELFSVELQEEKFRLIRTFVWISAAVFTAMMTLAFASLTVVYFFWASARLAVLGGLTALYAVALVAIIVALRRYLARQPQPFAATLQEIGEDRACIQTRN
ncbi:phage holin family protein [Ancylobacter sp.]|uniref:phage holin family protein n=1 Tax=Ancylobacter sp. TaxID=1872567 RepID=UPI003C7D0189